MALHATASGAELHQPFKRGLDAAKPASPAAGDYYEATDSKVLYTCKTAGTWELFSSAYDRGDPAAADFTLATPLTTDGAYHDLDLSSIVPAGAKMVCLRVLVEDNAAGSYVRFRKNGNTNDLNYGEIYTQVSGVLNSADIIVACDVNRVIEYKATSTTFTGISITVKAWW